MRETKYRLWINGKFHYWGFIDGGFSSPIMNSNVDPLTMKEFEERSQQFIGLFDKSSKEIYEETLLKDPQGNIGRVFYSVSSASYLVNWHRKDGTWDTDSCIGYGEVVGNMIENPEMLNDDSDSNNVLSPSYANKNKEGRDGFD